MGQQPFSGICSAESQSDFNRSREDNTVSEEEGSEKREFLVSLSERALESAPESWLLGER